jgi:hypothetical protein
VRRILSGLAISLLAVIWFFRPVLYMEIKLFGTDDLLYRDRVEPGYTFATLIKHSVHLSPVYEYYRIDGNGRIAVTGTKLQDLGWGVPSTFSDDFKFENGFMVITNMDKPIGFLPFRISYIACPHLLLDNGKRDIDLAALFDNWERIDIYANREPYIFYLLRGEVDAFPEKKTG